MKIGIIGAGWIADKMAETLTGLDNSMKYAIAARDLGRAQEFAKHWGFQKAYGSYKEMVEDPEVDLVYVATPHSHHFEHASLAINAGKPVLCEKAFTANAREADALLNLAHKKGIFITEAIWTRYMPLSMKVKELLDSGAIGQPRLLNASLCYMMEFKERILRPDLCGGALLDLGVYSINFCRMYFGADIINESTNCIKSSTGMKTTYIHDLVAKVFLGERPQGHDIDHRDGNKLNNSVSNLHYVTRKENQMNPNNHGMNGYQAYAARKVIAIKDGIERTFDNCSELCKALGMLPSSVSHCLSGKIHTHRGYSLRWA